MTLERVCFPRTEGGRLTGTRSENRTGFTVNFGTRFWECKALESEPRAREQRGANRGRRRGLPRPLNQTHGRDRSRGPPGFAQ